MGVEVMQELPGAPSVLGGDDGHRGEGIPRAESEVPQISERGGHDVQRARLRYHSTDHGSRA